MKQPPKFRFWNKITRKMNRVGGIDYPFDESLGVRVDVGEFNEAGCVGVPIEYGELLQFTGIKNRKGQEIYEGDILKFNYGENHGVGKVVFAMQGFYIESKHGALFQDTVPTMEHSEVIGNIYENPELLK